MEARPLAEIPPPVVHTAFGAAVCAVAVLVRPETLGLTRSAMASASLAVLTGLLLAGYDRVAYPRMRRPPMGSVAVPVAAVGSFATVLAGVPDLSVRIAAGIVAALVVGGVPQLVGRASAGRQGVLQRLLRDLAGAAVLAPVLVAGASPVLPTLARFALVAAVCLLVSYDSLRADGMGVAAALACGAAIGVVVAGAAHLAGVSETRAGYRAAALLVLWYGLRGASSAIRSGDDIRHGVTVAAEYAAFVVLAAGALRWMVLVNP